MTLHIVQVSQMPDAKNHINVSISGSTMVNPIEFFVEFSKILMKLSNVLHFSSEDNLYPTVLS